MKAKPQYTDWLTKENAAAALNVSTKTLERMAARKLIESRDYKRPEGGAVRKIYHPADVARMRKKLQPDAAPFVLPAEPAASPPARAAQPPAAGSLTRALETTLAAQIANAAQIIARAVASPDFWPIFLTRRQAADYSGLPRTLIMRAILAGDLPAIKTGRGWRIRRVDLEDFDETELYGIWRRPPDPPPARSTIVDAHPDDHKRPADDQQTTSRRPADDHPGDHKRPADDQQTPKQTPSRRLANALDTPADRRCGQLHRPKVRILAALGVYLDLRDIHSGSIIRHIPRRGRRNFQPRYRRPLRPIRIANEARRR